MFVIYKSGFIFAIISVIQCKYNTFLWIISIGCYGCYVFGVILSDAEMAICIKNRIVTMSLEKVLSTICFVPGVAFLIAAICGQWRHFFTMGLCFAVGIMISEDRAKPNHKKKRHEER